MKRTLILTAMVSVLGIATQATAQDRTRTSPTPAASPSLETVTPDKNSDSIVCPMRGLNVTREGIGYYCTTPKSNAVGKKTYLFIIDPSEQVGISTALDFLNSANASKHEIATRFKSPSKKSQRVCNLIMGPAALNGKVTCREVISFGWQK